MCSRQANCRQANRRQGSVLVLIAFLMVVMLGMVALAIDIGWICFTKTQLQSASDAGSLAGGTELLSGLGASAYRTPSEVDSAASNQAVNFVAQHRAGEAASAHIESDRDIRFGTAAMNPLTGDWTFIWGAVPYNAVGVTTLRSNVGTTAADGPLPLIFAPILGRSFTDVTTSSVAVIMPASGIRIPPGSGITSGLTPFAYEGERWRKYWRARKYFEDNNLTANDLTTANGGNRIMDPLKPAEALFYVDVKHGSKWIPEILFDDQYGVVNPELETSANIVNSGDGILEMNIYPISSTEGNFGTVDIGHSGNSTNDLVRQILGGISEQDLIDLGQVSITPPLELEGDTGVSAGIKAALASIIGQCRSMLLYSAVSGPGNNTVYQIEQMVGIRFMEVDFQGNNKVLIVQPCSVSDPAAVPNYDEEIGEETTFFTSLILAD